MNFTESMLKEKLKRYEQELEELLSEYHMLVSIAQQRGFYHALDLLWEKIQRVEESIKSDRELLKYIETEKQEIVYTEMDGIYLSDEAEELLDLMERKMKEYQEGLSDGIGY